MLGYSGSCHRACRSATAVALQLPGIAAAKVGLTDEPLHGDVQGICRSPLHKQTPPSACSRGAERNPNKTIMVGQQERASLQVTHVEYTRPPSAIAAKPRVTAIKSTTHCRDAINHSFLQKVWLMVFWHNLHVDGHWAHKC